MTIKILLITYRRAAYIAETINELADNNTEIFVYSNAWNEENSKFDVLQTRSIIEAKVREGKVQHTYFRDNNLPVEKSIPTAIDWFFSNVEKGVILEDDCIPLPGSVKSFKEVLSEVKKNQLIHINFIHFPFAYCLYENYKLLLPLVHW